MSRECIKNCRPEDTGFICTMSLIQDKYKMFIPYGMDDNIWRMNT